jgi:2-aminoethylphosphonate-pyruvate transaminase
MGSRDPKFIQIIQNIRASLLKLSSANPEHYTAVLLQGSGTYAIEATFHTVVRKESDKYSIILRRVLVVSNGAYGER